MASTPTETEVPYATMQAIYWTYTGDPVELPFTDQIREPLGFVLPMYLAVLFICTSLVGLRLYVRRYIVKNLGFDDFMLVAALFSLWTYVIFSLYMVVDVQVRGMIAAFWTFSLLQKMRNFPYLLMMILVRGAVATFFLRAMPRYSERAARWTVLGVFWFFTAVAVTRTFVVAWECGNPMEAGSFTMQLTSVCMPNAIPAVLNKSTRYLSIIMDWVMCAVPVYLIARSNFPLRVMLSAIGILVISALGSLCSVLSLVFYPMSALDNPADVPHVSKFFALVMWENGAAIICLSLAALRPLFKSLADPPREDRPSQEPPSYEAASMGKEVRVHATEVHPSVGSG